MINLFTDVDVYADETPEHVHEFLLKPEAVEQMVQKVDSLILDYNHEDLKKVLFLYDMGFHEHVRTTIAKKLLEFDTQRISFLVDQKEDFIIYLIMDIFYRDIFFKGEIGAIEQLSIIDKDRFVSETFPMTLIHKPTSWVDIACGRFIALLGVRELFPKAALYLKKHLEEATHDQYRDDVEKSLKFIQSPSRRF